MTPEALTSYIPAAVFLAIVASIVWIGFNHAARIRAKAAAQMDAHLEAVNRNTRAIERIAAALEAQNQRSPTKSK